MNKTRTKCCALAQISGLSNSTTLLDIASKLKELRHQSKFKFNVGDGSGLGQTSIFTIITPNEDELSKTLIKAGFNLCHKFNRRTGYPKTGELRMYIVNL